MLTKPTVKESCRVVDHYLHKSQTFFNKSLSYKVTFTVLRGGRGWGGVDEERKKERRKALIWRFPGTGTDFVSPSSGRIGQGRATFSFLALLALSALPSLRLALQAAIWHSCYEKQSTPTKGLDPVWVFLVNCREGNASLLKQHLCEWEHPVNVIVPSENHWRP